MKEKGERDGMRQRVFEVDGSYRERRGRIFTDKEKQSQRESKTQRRGDATGPSSQLRFFFLFSFHYFISYYIVSLISSQRENR